MLRRAALIFVTLLSFLSPAVQEAVTQTQLTENTLQLDEGAEPASADLKAFSWLIGRWIGEGLGGECEEVFLPIWNNSMTGTFRLFQQNQLVFSEYFSLMKTDDEGVILGLKHFHPNMVSWEEKDAMAKFRLIQVENNTAYFSGLTYKLSDEGELRVWVALRNNEGDVDEATFSFRRADRFAEAASKQIASDQDASASGEATGTRAIRKSVEVTGTLGGVWKLWTTSEGIAKFFSPDSKIELRPGGAYDIYFGLEPDENGLRGSEGGTVVSFLPNEFLIFEWTFPPNTPNLRRERRKTHVMVKLSSVSNDKINVELVHYGWESGGEWDIAYDYFDRVWPFVLNALKQAIEKE
ncbi:MAG TPA: DUF6265 family protein [Pirellulaceae bacterium]|nr:DUF6265 family protein [Pirellulaceae bacterium]HMO91940.1 DUF6265 family protein [Pirellulaceae bacterium]HMP68739.1 DUF6265 family protein [Pirellulaceae bacterium]